MDVGSTKIIQKTMNSGVEDKTKSKFPRKNDDDASGASQFSRIFQA